jgi:pimeloyl-ACP methyl ester carboxylesterase
MESSTNPHDDDLEHFEAHGAAPLPVPSDEGYAEHEGARIWYASYGAGAPVILLHGGLGHSGNWGYQVPALLGAGHRVVVVDSRGHGRSTRDARPYRYELMASDVLAVMDTLQLERAALVGWSDGACVAMVLGSTKPFAPTPVIERCFSRQAKDYAQLSSTPDDFEAFVGAVSTMMKTEPNYSADDLALIDVPVAIVQSEHDEFIKPEHADYLARSIPGAELILLPGVSHFAPLQRPAQFNRAMLDFLRRIAG